MTPAATAASGRKTIYLINPASGSNVAGLSECIEVLGYRYLCANLSLPTLAALVDESKYEVVICDENVDTIDYELPCDIVGLTIYHYQREHTFEIARRFRDQGKCVIVGGPFATQNMQDGHPLFDVVFCGEAERTWPQFLDDFLSGHYQRLYIEREHPDISHLPPPRFDLMRHNQYLLGALQVSRGCPYKCDFCSSTVLYGHQMRYKTDQQILAELQQLHSLGYRAIFLLDDNLSGDRERAKEVLAAIAQWNAANAEPVMFSTSASIDIAWDPGLAQLFADALVTNVFIGLETPSTASLAGAGKVQNLRSDPLTDIASLHRLGIDVAAGIMVGFDDDDNSIFPRQLAFLQSACIPICFCGMMLAPDGTPLKERLIAEGRYRGIDNVRDHTYDTNVVPKRMSTAELRAGYFWLMKQLYDESNFLRRVAGALTRFPPRSPIQKRYQPREVRQRRRLVQVLARLAAYYVTLGPKGWKMLLKAIPLLIRHYEHAPTTIYWLIAFIHFRRMLIRHGAYQET